jgi:MFS family permease
LALQKLPRAASGSGYVIFLIALALFISYVDRGHLSTAGPAIEKALGLSATRFGLLITAFYVTYVVGMIPAGWLAERFGGYIVLGAGVAAWSVATLLMGAFNSFAMLLGLRLLLGIGESVTFPCLSKLIASTVPARRIGLANGLIAFGYLFGAAIGTLLGGLLMVRIGWSAVFVLFGALSLLWLLPWSRIRVHEPRISKEDSGAPSFRKILRQRGLWGASLGHFSGNYTYYFILGWLPNYLIKSRGFSISSMAKVASTAYLISAVLALFAGWATDRWVKRGRTPDVAYKSIMALHHIGAIVCMLGMALLPVVPSIACLFAYMAIMAFAAPATFAIPQILAGPTATGRWVGIQSTCGNLAAVFASYITGFLIDKTGHYESGFAAAALINVLGIVGWVFILPAVRPILWDAAAESKSPT